LAVTGAVDDYIKAAEGFNGAYDSGGHAGFIHQVDLQRQKALAGGLKLPEVAGSGGDAITQGQHILREGQAEALRGAGDKPGFRSVFHE
jgi:hypothetical protein